jgi:arylsulfatase A-like enzyme
MKRFVACWAMLGLLAAQGCDRSAPSTADAERESNESKEAVHPAIVPGVTNVIFLIVDTLRADHLGSYGDPRSTSPEIDRLADTGVRFARAISQCSWTRPSIGSMLTGIYPRTLGLYKQENERLPAKVQTLAEIFAAKGYTTLGVTANPNINDVFGFDQGFDAYVNSQRVWPWMNEEADVSEEEHQVRATAPGQLATAREVFAKAIELVDAHPMGPYFIQLNIMELHPWGPALRAAFATQSSNYEYQYLAKLRQASFDVGAFIEDALSRPGFEDTLVVIVSDHGEGTYSDPGIPSGVGHGLTLYETNTHVPLIFHHSKQSLGAGVVIEQPVRMMDVYPTLVELFGWPVPDEIDGVSLASAFADPEEQIPLPEFFVLETYFTEADKQAVYSPEWNFYRHEDVAEQPTSKALWKGLDPVELQRARKSEVGTRTNQLSAHPEEGARLHEYLSMWEAGHPKARPTPTDALDEEVEAQLRKLGYIE